MSAAKVSQPPNPARPLTEGLAEVRVMRGLWFGLLIAVTFWLILALLVIAVL